MRDRPYEEVMIERFRRDPAYAVELLNAVLEDGDQEELMDFLPLITAALGEAPGAVRQPPNPSTDAPAAFTDFLAALRGMGLRLSVAPTTPLLQRAHDMLAVEQPV